MTNPPSVPSLDVEACVRLLKELLIYKKLVVGDITPQEETLIRDFASALPGMGKDSQRLDWLNGRLNWFTTQGPGHDPQYRDIRERIDAAQTMTPEYVAARAAQPEECATCGGSGEIEVSQTRSAKCVNCDGSGRRRAAQPEETSADD